MFSKYWLNYSMVANDDNSKFLAEFLRERRHMKFFLPVYKFMDREKVSDRINVTKKKFEVVTVISKKVKENEEISSDEAKQLDDIVQ